MSPDLGTRGNRIRTVMEQVENEIIEWLKCYSLRNQVKFAAAGIGFSTGEEICRRTGTIHHRRKSAVLSMKEIFSKSYDVYATGGIPLQVQDGVTGFIVPTGDVDKVASRLEELVSQQDLRAKMGGAARRVVGKDDKRFNVAQLANWLHICETVETAAAVHKGTQSLPVVDLKPAQEE
ncbi:hypothetical protein HK405_005371 [Cladochytrium tenue]|nr:hypothetical protein HK405_005371 [Cladochytrium tenue]